MKLEKALFQRGYIAFIVFFGLVLLGFWFTYITRIFEQDTYRTHTHGLVLTLWCLLLIVQPLLIRKGQRGLHRMLGKGSYVLAPLIVYTSAEFLKFRLSQKPALTAIDYFFVALVINALVVFVIFYGLALYHRKKPTIHARYMAATVFPFITPATDRIMYIYFPEALTFFPAIEGNPVVPWVGFVLADICLLALSIWDWKAHRRWNVFPACLLLVLAYQYSVLNFYKFEWWQQISSWFAGL